MKLRVILLGIYVILAAILQYQGQGNFVFVISLIVLIALLVKRALLGRKEDIHG